MNLEDVAKRAKVSTATVSRVLNNVGRVRHTTSARVLQAVEELKYTPNLNARMLAGGQSRTLGMIVSNLENPFFLDIFRTLEADAHRRGYEVLVANTDYRPQYLVSSVHLMLGRRVSGLAVVVSEMKPSLIRELAESQIPVVFYDVGTARPNITNIKVDYRKGMQRIIEYLHGLGHRRMAFIGHHPTLEPLNDRKRTFLELAADYAPRMKVMTVASADGPIGGQNAAREILSSGFRPTAIVCVNDFMALGVLRELHAQGIAVPDEISVTGFDDIGLAGFVSPALTTAHIPREEIGHLIGEALIPGPRSRRSSGREIRIDTGLVVRESTARAPSRAAGRRTTAASRARVGAAK
ncbi:MAG TPA: LacI family DNA-binding transcriptional regulator [Gemmatimonadaceae bacterium]|nr:LacI family DNA-binding transcriptional regulator [Gemmatimonadaceae bacterium]